MSQVTVSDKWRVTIPKEVRERLKIRIGQKLTMTEHGGIIRLTLEGCTGEANTSTRKQT